MPAPMYVSMVSAMEPQQQQKELSVRRRDVITGIRKKILKGAVVDMGKKHKKHKGDKHGHEGKDERAAESRKGGKAGHSEKKKDKKYVEKPLKLVLKVGTGEVKELSTARASAIPHGFHEDKADHDKHRDKKKKKKKKNEKTFGPGEEKKKKKDDKKKKEKSQRESDPDDGHTLHSPLRPDLPAISVQDSSLVKPEEEQTPLQEALNQLIRQLQRKDPSSFFAFPVTDFIAPGYSMIIKHPMDFSTIKEKIRNNAYDSIEELKENFKQICHNAMIYNKPGTIYFKAAKKLLNSGMKILSQERIQSLKQSIEFMADLQIGGKDKDNPDYKGNVEKMEEPKEESMDTSDFAAFKTPAKDFKRKDKDQSEDKQRINEAASEKEQEQIDQIIRDSFGKLTKRAANSQLEFERRKQDGTTTLALLNPGDTALEPGHGTAILGSTAGRLQTGVNCLQGFKEDKRNKVTPVLYLNYGPFTSYAPSYDSTFANIGKDDSDLIYTMYGEDPSLQGTFSIQQFMDNITNQPYGMVDCILDAFSDGEYSRTERQQNKAAVSETSAKSDCVGTTDQFASLKSVVGLGLFEEAFDSQEAEKFQRKLDETTRLLWELQEVQNERLSTKPPPNMVCLLAPSVKEVQIADKVNENLKELTQQVHPGDIVSVSGIRKAMGIIAPYVDTEDMVVDLTTDTQERKAIPKNGSQCLQIVS
ncbi:bromodomain-containing protein 7 isoform X2 [Aquarana catesbeiana]|uniref:bromodomain-containing protein 7 isoform X2 n=1 Tax=Aquarana catesbeiana TaxID=8400 RepID=UPI003CC962DD